MNPEKQALALIDFIHQSPTPFHVIENVEKQLSDKGYKYLSLTDEWQLKVGGRYYAKRNQTALFAFELGNSPVEESGLKLICAHSDSPGFRIKPQPEMVVDNHFLKLNTEVYGGPILMSWLDRPLTIAGRVILKSKNPFVPNQKLINFKRPLVVIPNLAIHLNRSINEGVELNKQKDMLPLLGIITDQLEKENYLLKLIAEELKTPIDDILDFDLSLAETDKGCLFGANNEFISSAKLDDLAMVHAGLTALLNSSSAQTTKFLCIFDNEEVGSLSKQGAGAPILKHILERIFEKLGKSKEDYQRAIYQSFMISADMAHSVHPNSPEKHDPIVHPLINKGPVIKIHAGQKYTTDADSSAVYEQICKMAGVPVQQFVNRSDMLGGSTLGNISTGHVDIRTVDMGNPMLAMHSMRETAGVLDHSYAIRSFEMFYNA